ncbi:MAG: hypothetical protein EOO38_26205 [Cytophagaceae bacterium]|nr:MAG: hypothetical protein EOO38_26205 [Cytophagaceae bacterium]
MPELSEDHQRANRLHLAMLDMQDARRYLDGYAALEPLQNELMPELFQTLCETAVIAAIVAYCRPFKRNASSGQAVKKLSLDDFHWIVNNEVQKALHVHIVAKRDQFVAHADWSARSTQVVELTATGVTRTFSDPDVMEALDVKDFAALAFAIEKDCFYQAMALQHRMHKAQSQGG